LRREAITASSAISVVVSQEAFFSYAEKVSFSLTRELGIAASALKPPLAGKIRSEKVSRLKSYKVT